jgi:O-antigen/teichoic acid export membrane protein
MAESLFYFVPQAPGEAGRFALNSTLALAVAGLGSLALLIVLAPAVGDLLGAPAIEPLLPLLGLYLALMLASSGMEIVLTAHKRFVAAAGAYAGSDAVRALLFVLPVLLVPRLEWLLLGGTAFAAARLGAFLLCLRREFGDRLRPDAALFKRQIAYALPFEMYVIVEILQMHYHQYVVASSFDAATFAVYAVGCLQVPLFDLLAGSAGNVMMVRMTEERRVGRSATVLAAWHDTTAKLAWAFLPLVALLLLNARDLIALVFTEAYLPSVPVFMVWTGVFLLSALPLDGVMRVFAQTRFLLLLGIVKVLVIAVTIHWFLSAMGLPGAVAVTILASCLAKGVALARLGRLLQVGVARVLPWRRLARSAACAAAAALPAAVAASAVGDVRAVRMLVSGLVYAVAYLALSRRSSIAAARAHLVAMRSGAW